VACAAAQGHAVRERFAQVEAVASRFRPEAELARLNADPRPEVPVSALLAELLAAAATTFHASGGLLDPTVCERLEAWGYDRTFAAVVPRTAVPRRRRVPGFASVDVTDGTVCRPPGMRLDLGGVAKAWTVDSCASLVPDGYVNAGGDMRAFGDCTVPVHVRDAWDEDIAVMPVRGAALAGSGVSRRRWRVGETWAHHLIDPRTGAPAETDVVSATALATTAVAAEAAARLAVLLGAADGLAALARYPGVRAGLVVTTDGAVHATRTWLEEIGLAEIGLAEIGPARQISA